MQTSLFRYSEQSQCNDVGGEGLHFFPTKGNINIKMIPITTGLCNTYQHLVQTLLLLPFCLASRPHSLQYPPSAMTRSAAVKTATSSGRAGQGHPLDIREMQAPLPSLAGQDLQLEEEEMDEGDHT